MMAYKGIGWSGFLMRLLAAFVLVFASYNPSGYSYYHLVVAQISSPTPWLALVGILLLIGWAIFLRATTRSLGVIGLLLAAALMGVLLWMMIDWGWFRADGVRAVTYIILVVICWILAIGVSWSHIRRRITGQVDVDEVDGDL
jgi:hypothetical protein